MLLARIYESQVQGWGLRGAPRMHVFPLVCTGCGKPMRIIAFVTEVGSVQRILEYLGEPTTPPRSRRPAAPPDVEAAFDPRKGTHPALNDPLPEYKFDQRVGG